MDAFADANRTRTEVQAHVNFEDATNTRSHPGRTHNSAQSTMYAQSTLIGVWLPPRNANWNARHVCTQVLEIINRACIYIEERKLYLNMKFIISKKQQRVNKIYLLYLFVCSFFFYYHY